MTAFTRMFSTAILGSVLVGAPLLAQNVATDYDHSVQFNKLKSYSWAKVQASDPLVEPRLTIAIDRVLQGLGWHLVEKNEDVAISAVDATTSVGEYGRFYRGLTGYTWQRGWGSGGFTDASTSLREIPVGTLIVDMYDPSTKKLIWRGTAGEPTVGKVKTKEDDIDKTVNSMFAKFPPK